MLQTDLRSDTPAARQRFTDRRPSDGNMSLLVVTYSSRHHRYCKHTLHAARCTHHFSTLLMRASLSLPEHAIVARYYVDRILLPGLTERRLLDVSAMSISVAHRSIHTVHTSRSHVSCSVKVMPRG
jgi:hypothetical protein